MYMYQIYHTEQKTSGVRAKITYEEFIYVHMYSIFFLLLSFHNKNKQIQLCTIFPLYNMLSQW